MIAAWAASFWPKNEIRFHDVEELADHSRHAAEVSWPRAATEPFAKPFNSHERRGARRIYLLHTGSKQQRNVFRLKHPAVALEITRIFLEIFVGTELSGVHKYRCHHIRGLLARCAHQRKVALMQRPHSGNQAYAMVLRLGGAHGCAHLLGAREHFHRSETRHCRVSKPDSNAWSVCRPPGYSQTRFSHRPLG
jgi:hypothetical protein